MYIGDLIIFHQNPKSLCGGKIGIIVANDNYYTGSITVKYFVGIGKTKTSTFVNIRFNKDVSEIGIVIKQSKLLSLIINETLIDKDIADYLIIK